MADDPIQDFLLASARQRLEKVRDPGQREILLGYLGPRIFAEYQGLAARTSRHLGGRAPNLVFVPGVMGSLLLTRKLAGVWWIDARTRRNIDKLRLSPDGLSDANPDYDVVPCAVDPSYEPFLAAVLERDDFEHVNFPYDWRKPLAASAQGLRDRIVELHAANGGDPIHLVAHSMGGLLVRTTLVEYGEELWSKIGRIVFLATPHYGSPAIGGYLKNHLWGFDLMAVLGLYLGRETYRSLWGVLSLLPAPRGVYPGTRSSDLIPWTSGEPGDLYPHPCCNFDLYRAEAWNLGLRETETSRLQTILDGVAGFHRKLYAAHVSLSQELRDRMLVIAGVGNKTLFRLANRDRIFGIWEQMDKETGRIAGDPHRDGDGRVPVAAAALEDVAIRYVKGVHGGIPNIPSVYQDALRWLKEERLELAETPEGALSQHLGPLEVSEAPHLDGTARRGPTEDDPGYWNLDAPTGDELQQLDARIEAGQLPEFITTRLF